MIAGELPGNYPKVLSMEDGDAFSLVEPRWYSKLRIAMPPGGRDVFTVMIARVNGRRTIGRMSSDRWHTNRAALYMKLTAFLIKEEWIDV